METTSEKVGVSETETESYMKRDGDNSLVKIADSRPHVGIDSTTLDG